MTGILPGYLLGMPSSIARLADLDHQRILRLLRRAVTEGPSQQRWRDEVVHLVTAHRAGERAALTCDGEPAAGPRLAAGTEQLASVDAELDEAVRALAAAPVPSPDLAVLGDQVGRLVRSHAETMSEHVLNPLADEVPRKELRRLGGIYETRRDDDLRRSADRQPPPRRLDLTRAELYELARRAGIEGRSAMSRGDLIDELQRREPPS